MLLPRKLRKFYSVVCVSATLAALLALAGCGYKLGAGGPDVLPQGQNTLALSKVDNPTLKTWLEPQLRADIRDELSARNIATWRDSGDSDFSMEIKILRYTESSYLTNEREETLKYVVDLRLEAKLFSSDEKLPVWESGPISVQEYYYNDAGLEEAKKLAVSLASRELADRMGDAF